MKVSAGICGTLLLALTAIATNASASEVFDGNLVNEEVVMPQGQALPVTAGAYDAALAISWDAATNIGCGHFVWSGLSGKPTALHVHIGLAGANTTTRYSVPVPAGDAPDGDVFFRLQGNAAFGTAIKSQGVYGDIHTVKFAGGEVRAQLDADPDNTVECPESVPLALDGAVADAGTDGSTPTTSSSSASSSSSSSSGADDNDPIRTAPDAGTDAASKSAGGCNTTARDASNLSALLVLVVGLAALKRKRKLR